jgi:hypothetical protein
VGLPEVEHPLCLAGKLRAEADRLREAAVVAEVEAEAALAESQARADGEGKPKRIGETGPAVEKRAEADRIAAEYEALLERREAATVRVRFRGKPPGVWRDWCDHHPPREDSTADEQEMRGHCNADALRDSLYEWVVDVNGEPVTEAKWQQIAELVAHRDLMDAAVAVLSLHEARVKDPGKGSLKAWLRTRRDATD